MKIYLALILSLFSALSSSAKQISTTLPSESNTTSVEISPVQREPLGLLYFTASWCGPCQLMKSQTWPNPQVKAVLSDYRFRSIDVDQEPKLAEQWSVRAMPTYIITDPSGQLELTRMSGFMDADRMSVWLRDVFAIAYQTLEQQQAAQIAFQQEWAQIDPLFEETISQAALTRASNALFTLLARRDDLEPESAAKLERALDSLALTYPKRLVHGMRHEDLQVRAKIARSLRTENHTLNPWDSAEKREQAIQAYITLEGGVEK